MDQDHRLGLQERGWNTNPGRLQEFENKVNRPKAKQTADGVAHSMQLQQQHMQQRCFLESISSLPPVNIEIQSFAQQQRANCSGQAGAQRKEAIAGKPKLPSDVPAPRRRGGAGTPSKCSACGQPRLNTHERRGCPTHCTKMQTSFSSLYLPILKNVMTDKLLWSLCFCRY